MPITVQVPLNIRKSQLVIIRKLFILRSGGFPHFHRLVNTAQFSVHFHPSRMLTTLGGIFARNNAQPLCVALDITAMS